MSPPRARPNSQPAFREAVKEARSPATARKVSVIFEDHTEFWESGSRRLKALLKAPNVEMVKTHSGKVVALRLLSFEDQREHSAGERHGRSTVFTERVRNDAGELVGGDQTLKHKGEQVNHGNPDPPWTVRANRPILRPPLAV